MARAGLERDRVVMFSRLLDPARGDEIDGGRHGGDRNSQVCRLDVRRIQQPPNRGVDDADSSQENQRALQP